MELRRTVPAKLQRESPASLELRRDRFEALAKKGKYKRSLFIAKQNSVPDEGFLLSGLIGCIAELGIINTVDFRRGEVSPQRGVLNQLRKAVVQAKLAGKKIKRFRSDSAAHQNKIFRFCEEQGIEYYISLDKHEAIKVCIAGIKEDQWNPLLEKYQAQLGTQWAQMVYVTNEGISMRILVLRWANPDPTLFDEAPFCYHEFEKNRGYVLMGVIAYNMMQIMKLFYMGQEAINWTIKTIRYRFIHVCGKIVKTGRRFYCKIINVTQETFELFRNCKSKFIITGY